VTHAANPHPIITEARLKLAGRGRRVWDLYADSLLIGWTSTDPTVPPTRGGELPPFTPSCQQYGTGRHLIVAYAPHLQVS